jgi:hypothetical protein
VGQGETSLMNLYKNALDFYCYIYTEDIQLPICSDVVQMKQSSEDLKENYMHFGCDYAGNNDCKIRGIVIATAEENMNLKDEVQELKVHFQDED